MLFIFAHFGICHISQKRTECRLIKSLCSASRLIIGQLNLFGLTLVAHGDNVVRYHFYSMLWLVHHAIFSIFSMQADAREKRQRAWQQLGRIQLQGHHGAGILISWRRHPAGKCCLRSLMLKLLYKLLLTRQLVCIIITVPFWLVLFISV